MFHRFLGWMAFLAVALATPILGCGAKPTELICQTGYTLCSGKCVELLHNPRNCGACGNTCGQGQACQEGVCKDSCPSGFAMCSGECVKFKTDDLHCGVCGNACSQGQTCQDGACIDSCPSGFIMCGGECVKVQNDDHHCGACGQACGEGKSCSNGACVDACPAGQKYCAGRCVTTNEAECGCVANLLSATSDSWGAMWDGKERSAANLESARKSCEALGGRLPTATELYRVSANQSGEVGQIYTTNPLWSLVPADPANQITVTLHNGIAAQSLAATDVRYRCICPAAVPGFFAGRACHGAPGKECFNIASGGKSGRYNIDSADRVALPKGAALWECGYHHAQLPEFTTLVTAIREGLPNGSKVEGQRGVFIADDVRYDWSAVVGWSGTALNWEAEVRADGNVEAMNFSTSRPFRCVGLNYSPALPSVGKGQWRDPRTGLVGDSSDSSHASTVLPIDAHVNAHDVCWKKGGHLARTTELASLIDGGLPGGTGTWMQTADLVGIDSGRGMNARLKWSNDRTFDYRHPQGVTWGYKDDASKPAFRCVYYPVDEQYQEPKVCNGECVRIPLPNSNAIIWMDGRNRNRSPLGSAVHDCALMGGQLPLERDYVEAIRNGLPAGAGEVMTAEMVPGWGYQAIYWNGTEGDRFNTQDAKRSYPRPANTENPYRCMWTNELR